MKLVSPLAAALISAVVLSIATGRGGSSPSAPPITPSTDDSRAVLPERAKLSTACEDMSERR